MANTFDTSRVGGGTYELEQDASGNYNLKSVGFTQVNKLNLPDLKTSDTTSVADTTKKATEDTIKAQTTEVFKPMNTYGGGNQSNTSTPMLKTAEVNKPTVRSAGDAMTANAQSTRQNFDQSVKDLQDKSTIEMNEAQIAKLNAEGASPQIMAQAQAQLVQFLKLHQQYRILYQV
jgi:ethanolamine utilization microcompartment shell protein EutL